MASHYKRVLLFARFADTNMEILIRIIWELGISASCFIGLAAGGFVGLLIGLFISWLLPVIIINIIFG